MRKLLLLLMFIPLLFITGCSKKVENKKEDIKPIVLSKFEQFDRGIARLNEQYNVEITPVGNSGALEGVTYTFKDDCNIELFRFDKESDAYKNIAATNSITINSEKITDIMINENVILLNVSKCSDKERISSIFKFLN